MNFSENTTFLIRQEALRLGFMSCGFAKAVPLDEDARRLEAWLGRGFHASMQYMERHFDMRRDPSKLVPGARSVITLLMNYFPEEKQSVEAPLVAKYAWGLDYHDVIRAKLNELLAFIRGNIGAVEGRGSKYSHMPWDCRRSRDSRLTRSARSPSRCSRRA